MHLKKLKCFESYNFIFKKVKNFNDLGKIKNELVDKTLTPSDLNSIIVKIKYSFVSKIMKVN